MCEYEKNDFKSIVLYFFFIRKCSIVFKKEKCLNNAVIPILGTIISK